MTAIIPPSPIDARTTFKRLGRVADFCCICRTVRPFMVDETAAYMRFLLVPLRFTRQESLKGTCETCGLVIPIERDTYRTILEDKHADLVTLTQQTFPEILQVRARRWAREEALAGDNAAISPEERSFLIEEPIRAAGWMLHDIRKRSTTTDMRYKNGCLVSGLFFLAVMASLLLIENEQLAESVMWVCFYAMVLVGILTVTYRLRRTARTLRRQLYPMIGRSLQRLNPTLREFEVSVAGLKLEDAPEVHRFNPRNLYEAAQIARIVRHV